MNDFNYLNNKSATLLSATEMILKEEGGDSSLGMRLGTKMIEQSFYTTSKIAHHYTKNSYLRKIFK